MRPREDLDVLAQPTDLGLERLDLGQPFGGRALALAAVDQLGTLGGASSEATDVDDQVVVGTADTADEETHAFAYDLAAAKPSMVDLGTLGGGFSDATAIDDGTVVGESALPEAGSHAFAYDLGAASPHDRPGFARRREHRC